MSESMEIESSFASISYHSTDNAGVTGTDSRSDWQRIAPCHTDRLFHIILATQKTSIPDIVGSWIDQYKLDNEHAIHDLLQLFVDLASYQYINLESFLEFHEISDIVHHMEGTQNSVLLECGKYFLSLRQKAMVQRHEKIEDFIIILILKCALENILADFYMLKKSIGVIKDMAFSTNRAIKHTGVYLALKYQTGLIDTISQISGRLQKYQEKMQALSDKKALYKLTEKCEKYKIKYEHCNKVLDFLTLNIFNKSWNFGDRFLHYMRQDCIMEIKQWINLLPERYLQKHYLNIIIKCLTDNNYIVRLSALELISDLLYTHHEALEKDLMKYVIPIKNRIGDPNIQIKVRAVDAITSLCQLVDLPTNVQDRILPRMYMDNFKLAAACGRYFVEMANLNNPDIEDESAIVCKLIKFELKQNEKGFKEGLPYFIEAIYDACPRIQRISLYTDFIVKRETNVTIQNILIKIVAEIVRIGLTGVCSLKRKVDRKVKINEETKKELTQECIKALSTLLDFYTVEELTDLVRTINKYKVF